MRAGQQHQRVPVGGRLCHRFRRDTAAGTGLGFDDEGRAECPRQGLREDARDGIRVSAGAEALDEGDGAARPLLRPGRRDPERHQHCQRDDREAHALPSRESQELETSARECSGGPWLVTGSRGTAAFRNAPASGRGHALAW